MLSINNKNIGYLMINGTNPIYTDNNIYIKGFKDTTVTLIDSSNHYFISVISEKSIFYAKVAPLNGKIVTLSGALNYDGVLIIKSNQEVGIWIEWTAEVL